MTHLPNVTLACIQGRSSANIKKNDTLEFVEKIFRHSSKYINFGKNLLISSQIKNNRINSQQTSYIKIPTLSIEEYNIFQIKELYKYISTKYVLTFESDGFIVDGKLWKDEFLRHDYIGAPWPKPWNNFHVSEGNRVGNGGFCLRSKRLMLLCKDIVDDSDIKKYYDWAISQTYYKKLKLHGMKFAPLDIASQFSIEHDLKDLNKTQNFQDHFGFHKAESLSSKTVNALIYK